MPLFTATNIKKKFDTENKTIEVLQSVNFEISPGEMIAVTGASGSGKTTLLQICGTLALPSSGELVFDSNKLHEMSNHNLSAFRNREIGFIFQFHHLLPEFTALENVMMPALISGKKKSDVVERAKYLLDQVKLHHRFDHKISNLSGGEQQRAALARALMMKPRLLLADEPTGNLDSRSGNTVFSFLKRLCQEYTLTVIMVTHNMELAHQMDRVLTLKDGILHT